MAKLKKNIAFIDCFHRHISTGCLYDHITATWGIGHNKNWTGPKVANLSPQPRGAPCGALMGTSEGDFKFQFLCVGLKIETLTMFFSAEQKSHGMPFWWCHRINNGLYTIWTGPKFALLSPQWRVMPLCSKLCILLAHFKFHFCLVHGFGVGHLKITWPN